MRKLVAAVTTVLCSSLFACEGHLSYPQFDGGADPPSGSNATQYAPAPSTGSNQWGALDGGGSRMQGHPPPLPPDSSAATDAEPAPKADSQSAKADAEPAPTARDSGSPSTVQTDTGSPAQADAYPVAPPDTPPVTSDGGAEDEPDSGPVSSRFCPCRGKEHSSTANCCGCKCKKMPGYWDCSTCKSRSNK